jgi:hypothetical protein
MAATADQLSADPQSVIWQKFRFCNSIART